MVGKTLYWNQIILMYSSWPPTQNQIKSSPSWIAQAL